MARTRRVDLYYQAEDGISHMPATFRQAQYWLMEGYFEQTTKFKLMRAEGSFGDWETLGELMFRNGRSMPFIEDATPEEEKEKRDEEMQRLQEEMNELNNRKGILRRKLEGAVERHAHNAKELNRLASIAVAVPGMRTRSIQTQYTMNGASNGDSTKAADPPPEIRSLYPPAGVDPFALLQSCEAAKCKMPFDLPKSFKQLRDLFERCDKKLLVGQTRHLFATMKKCSLCQLKVASASVFLEHITCVKHVDAMNGVACEDAFKFWYNAVRNNPRNSSKSTIVKPGPSNSFQEQPKRSAQGAAPSDPPTLPVFSVLRPEKKVDKPCTNPKEELARMKKLFTSCDKKKLDNDPNTLTWFENPMHCLICNRCAIDKVANLISHITSTGHIEMILTENCPVSQNALDYWLDVIRRAKISNERNVKQQSSVKDAQEMKAICAQPIKQAKTKDEKSDNLPKLEAENIKEQSPRIIVRTECKVGDRCVWKGEEATVRWIGTLQEKQCAGLEFDDPVGQGTGMFQGTELFRTFPNYAGFVNIAELRRIDIETVTFMEYNGWKVGRRCIWEEEEATIRWIGTLKGHESIYAGLAFDEPVGEGTGTYQGTQLFHIADNHAGFVKISELAPLQKQDILRTFFENH